MNTVPEILTKWGKDTQSKLRNAFAVSGINASGSLSDSVEYTVTKESYGFRLVVDALGYVFTVEEGRGPTKKPQKDFSLFDAIREWIDIKNIRPRNEEDNPDGLAWAITKKIHEEGTAQYRERPNTSGIISGVINDNLVDNVFQEILNQYADSFLSGIAKSTKDGTNSE